MLESTNALIGALIGVIRETHRCETLAQIGEIPEDEEEALGTLIDQLHEALADLSTEYEHRRKQHASLLPFEELRKRQLQRQAG